MAWFQENEQLVEWVNQQSFDTVLNCVGDGHPGIWNLMNQFNRGGETRQILDWFQKSRKSLQSRWFTQAYRSRQTITMARKSR